MRLIHLRLLLFLLAIGAACNTQAQPGTHVPPGAANPPQIRVDRIPTDVLQSFIGPILHSRQGYLWLGAQGVGLVKYDGYTGKRIRFEHPDSPDLIIYDLVEDDQGFLWIATDVGLYYFDPFNETSIRFVHDPAERRSLSHNRVRGLYEDRQGTLWVAAQDGMNRFDAATKDFTFFSQPADEQLDPSRYKGTYMLEDRTGRFWIGSFGGISLFNPAAGAAGSNSPDQVRGKLEQAFTRYVPPPDGDPSDHGVTALTEDRRGRIWVGTNGGSVYRFDPETGDFENYRKATKAGSASGPGKDTIHGIVEDPESGLWLGASNSGLLWFDPETRRTVSYPHDPTDPHSPSKGLLISLYPDRQGGIWFSNAGTINYIDRGSGRFSHFFKTPLDAESKRFFISGSWDIASESDSIMWTVHRRSVLYRINRQTGTARAFVDDSENLSLRGLETDRVGTLWVGGNGLNRMDLVKPGVFTRYVHDPEDPTSLGRGYVDALLVDAQGVIWAGHKTGILSRMDPAQPGVFTRFPLVQDTLSPQARDILNLYEDSAGMLWAGTAERGLYGFDPESGAHVHYDHDPDMSGAGVSGSWIEGICERPEEPGVLWVAAYRRGLNRLDKKTGTLSYLTTKNSDLIDDSVFGLICDKDLWITTDKSVVQFDPERSVFTNYTPDDGLQGTFYPSYHQSPFTGEIFFGGSDGINNFFPDEVHGNPYAPPIVLTSLQIYTDSVTVGEDSPLQRPLAKTESITLRHDQDDLTFGYVGLHFSNPSENQYAYKLEPLDADWRMVGTQRTARFTNLDPGDYTFRVKAANSDGVWNEEGHSIAITILPPWWQTGWAYLLYGLLVMAGLVVADRAQRRRLQRKERTLELRKEKEIVEAQAEALRSLDEAKSRFFANISHEFRTPLTLILGPLEDLEEGYHGPLPDNVLKQLRTAKDNGRRLLRLVNQLLDVSRLESGKLALQARQDDMAAFVHRLAQSFMPLAERKRIDFRLQLPADPLLAYFDPEQFEKVLSNLLGNAFKFTPEEGAVVLTLAAEEAGDGFVLSVRDNGPGIAPEHLPHLFERFFQADASSTRRQPGTGIGLALVKSLVELHHGTIAVESEVEFGSTFTVWLPLGASHLSAEELASEPSVERFEERFEALLDEDEPDVLSDVVQPQASEADGQSVEADEDVTTVLVVDDNADVRAYLADHLRQQYRVLEAADGREALGVARSSLPDLVVSDVMMPLMDGYDLCRTIKQDPELGFIPVILLTARASTEDRIEGLEGGADDYLSKPFNVRELEVRVENLIALRQRLKAFHWPNSAGAASSRPVIHPSPVEVEDEDAVFLERVRVEIEGRLADESFGVETLCSALGLGRTTLYRRLGELVGEKPMELIWRMRLERAAQLLEGGVGSVNEVAYGVGFKGVSHFCKRFAAHFGMAPSAYAARSGSGDTPVT